jgi:HTH-type transcriptional regulator/antitoxin HigA
MNAIKAIKTEQDYQKALAALENIFDAKLGTPEGDAAELLIILIQDYERNHFPIEAPTPVEAIKFRMEQMNLRQADLAKYLGGESRVSEILNGKRSLTINMVSALNRELNIPLESLVTTKSRTIRAKRKLKYKTGNKDTSILHEPKVAYGKRKGK